LKTNATQNKNIQYEPLLTVCIEWGPAIPSSSPV